MKKIAITQRLVLHTEINETRDALDVRWARLFNAIGAVPVVLPTAYDDPLAYFEGIGIDGVILSGGNDLASISDDPLSKLRDDFEKRIIAIGIEKRLPIFGVCRGLQVINEYFGGTLEKVENHVRTQHAISAVEGSMYSDELTKLAKVNSFHSYGIIAIPQGFKAAARSADGYVEAIENDRLKIWAQMWHSEREEPLRKDELAIFIKHFSLKSL